MATTIVKKYDEPIVVDREDIRELLQQWLEQARGDEDKAGEIENSVYWEGCADTCEGVLKFMTGVPEYGELDSETSSSD